MKTAAPCSTWSRRTAEQCYIPLTVGGGVRTAADVRALLLAGADKVSFNSAAVANPDVVAEAADQFGSQCIVVAIDAKTVGPGQMGDLHPWRPQTHRHRRGRIRPHWSRPRARARSC